LGRVPVPIFCAISVSDFGQAGHCNAIVPGLRLGRCRLLSAGARNAVLRLGLFSTSSRGSWSKLSSLDQPNHSFQAYALSIEEMTVAVKAAVPVSWKETMEYDSYDQ
jgi:hypothetical protein